MGSVLQGLSKTFNLTNSGVALPLSALSNRSSAHRKYPFETEVKMISAGYWKMFDVNIPILPLTKTQTIFDTKEQIGWTLQKQFWGKFTVHSQTLISSSCKATQPQLQVICDFGLIWSKWEPNVYRFQVLIPTHPKSHFVCSVLKKIRVFLSPPTPLQTNPSCLWTSWHCVCPWACSKARQSVPFSLHGLAYQPSKGLGFRCGSMPGATDHSHTIEAGVWSIYRLTDFSLSQAPGNRALTCWPLQTSIQPLAPEDGSEGIKLYLTGWLRYYAICPLKAGTDSWLLYFNSTALWPKSIEKGW